MPTDIVPIIDALPERLRETLRAAVHANRNYREATDKDVARDLRVTDRTIRNRRNAMRRLGLPVPPLRGPGRPRKVA